MWGNRIRPFFRTQWTWRGTHIISDQDGDEWLASRSEEDNSIGTPPPGDIIITWHKLWNYLLRRIALIIYPIPASRTMHVINDNTNCESIHAVDNILNFGPRCLSRKILHVKCHQRKAGWLHTYSWMAFSFTRAWNVASERRSQMSSEEKICVQEQEGKCKIYTARSFVTCTFHLKVIK